MFGFKVLLFTILLIPFKWSLAQCPNSILGQAGELFIFGFCKLYTKSDLAKLSSHYITPNATISYKNYDPITGQCLPMMQLPIPQFLPLVFRYEHACNALIPTGSNIGSDGYLSITGFAENMLTKSTVIREMTFIFTTTTNCAVRLEQILMKDVRCVAPNTLTTSFSWPSSFTGPSSYFSTDISSISTTLLSTARTTQVYRTSGFPYDRYTSVPGILDSLELNPLLAMQGNNPLAHMCPFKSGALRLINSPYNRRQADLACLQAGLRLASITRTNLQDAITVVGACLGPNKSAWIKDYWNRTPQSSCLEVMSGITAHSGGINMPSNCGKLQPVICQDPYFDV